MSFSAAKRLTEEDSNFLWCFLIILMFHVYLILVGGARSEFGESKSFISKVHINQTFELTENKKTNKK